MPKVVGYHRPSSIDEALGLLSQDGSAVLAGGTVLNADRSGEPVVAVDLQALGLDGVEQLGDGRLRLGAMVTLQALADHADVPASLRDVARRELPSTLRTLATVGGTVFAGGGSSALLAALLAHDASVEVVGPSGTSSVGLAGFLASPPAAALVVAVSVDVGGACAAARTARTPGDEPIVSAYARATAEGVRTALSGVGHVPVLVEDPAKLDPPGDFRGSTEYRRHVAGVLVARVRAEVSA